MRTFTHSYALLYSQGLPLKLQGQGHGCGQGAMSYSRPSIISTHFLFISHQSDQQFLRYSYFEIWPWNIQGQGHGWGQRSRSHIIPSIKPMHFLFISHQLDQSFLRYMTKVVFDLEKTHPKVLKKLAKITVSYRSAPKPNQVITMTRAMKLPCFVVIRWVVLTLSRRQANLCYSMPQPWPWVKVMERLSSTFPQTHIIFVSNI